jgi:hypothetical protein
MGKDGHVGGARADMRREEKGEERIDAGARSFAAPFWPKCLSQTLGTNFGGRGGRMNGLVQSLRKNVSCSQDWSTGLLEKKNAVENFSLLPAISSVSSSLSINSNKPNMIIGSRVPREKIGEESSRKFET